MAISELMRERAHEMFSKGETTERVARSIRQSVESTRALRANWTRNLTPAQAKRVTKKAPSSSKVSPKSVSFSDPTVVRINSTRLQTAIRNGQPVSLLIDI